jgi:hypothetical protein
MWKGEWKAYTAWLALPLVGIVGAIAVLSVPGLRPPLHVRQRGAEVLVDVQTLGEYKTTITRIRLSEKGRIIWEVRAVDSTPQIHTFGLRLGANALMPILCGGGSPSSCLGRDESVDFVVMSPSPGTQFSLEPGKEYEVEVWNGRTWLSKASASFTLAPP